MPVLVVAFSAAEIRLDVSLILHLRLNRNCIESSFPTITPRMAELIRHIHPDTLPFPMPTVHWQSWHLSHGSSHLPLLVALASNLPDTC